MTDILLFVLAGGLVVLLSVALRRAFVRIAELQRAADSIDARLAQLEPPATTGARSPISQTGVRSPIRQTEGSLPGETSAALESRSLPLQREETAHESLESRIGTRWLLYVGIIAIVVGVAYFEKLAIENEWIGVSARIAQGAGLGLALVFAGTRFARSGYRLYGQMMSGGGTAILYVSTYAAFNFYHLIDRPAAFAIMVAITGGGAWLADSQMSQGLALFAVGGGFATPFLLPGTTDAQFALFGFDAILIGATMILSRRRNWPILNVLSYVATMLTVASWAGRFYGPEKYRATELFLTVFCAMFLVILRECRRRPGDGAAIAALALWTAPAAYYMASLAVLQGHDPALLTWLAALMLTGGIFSERAGSGVGFAAWLAVTLPLLGWSATHAGSAWREPGLAATAAIYLIALAAQLRRTLATDSSARRAVDVAWLHGNGLLLFAAAQLLISPGPATTSGLLAAGFGAWQVLIAVILVLAPQRDRDEALHFAALGFTLVSIAIALEFDGPAVTVGWAVEGAGVIALGLRERRDWLRLAGTVLFAIAIGRGVWLLVEERAVGESVLLNARAACGAVIVTLCYVLAWRHQRSNLSPAVDSPSLARATEDGNGANRGHFGAIAAALVAAQAVTLVTLTSEIHAYWVLREGRFAREAAMSVTWALYSTALIVIGLRRNYAPIRYFAMVVFSVTILKVLFVDMAQLDRLYRVMSVIGLGVLLLISSYLYTRFQQRNSAIDDRFGRG